MPAPTIDTSGGSYGAGYLWWAQLGSAEPTYAAAGSVFTDVVTAPYIPLGPTLEGNELETAIETDQAYVAEILDSVKTVTTTRTTTISFSLYNTTAQNYKRVMNGGTLATVSGSGGSLISSFDPVQAGQEIRAMLLFESTQNDERAVLYQVMQVGSITERRRKGSDYNIFPAQFRCEVYPTNGRSIRRYYAGTTRLGT
jgi:hypothetical protein